MTGAAIDWTNIRLVIFDVDGTLYRQRPVRLRMARDLAADALRRRDPTPIRVLGAYRRLRETIGDEEIDGFEPVLIARTADATRTSSAIVAAIVSDWIERRPLPYLRRARYAGIETLFAALRRHGKIVAVLSDYPAVAKLAALGLAADVTISAADPGIGILKPHPRGIAKMLAETGVKAGAVLFIGDRIDRDGAAAQRAGVQALIRSPQPIDGWTTVADFTDSCFDAVREK